jgi:hypothetical protein
MVITPAAEAYCHKHLKQPQSLRKGIAEKERLGI